MRVHLFYPENDLALARDIVHYTAPPAAVRLRRSGYTLPMWYGDRGDAFFAQGVNVGWLDTVRSSFDIGTTVWNHDCSDAVPVPWGWSKACRQFFANLGFGPGLLPDDARLAAIRELSHRRTAASVAERLAGALPFAIAPVAREMRTLHEIRSYVMDEYPGGAVLKLPWSSSGRGVIATDASIFDSQSGNFIGMLHRQGSVMGEPRHRKLADFAMLFKMNGGKCTYSGISVFNNVQLGTYAGNELSSQDELTRRICAICGDEQFYAVRDALPPIIESVAAGYEGALGVDMMAVDNPDYVLAPVTEINFRMTFGHVCRIIYDRYIAPGARGIFTIAQALSPACSYSCRDGRLTGGVLNLAQPGSDVSFLIEIE